VTARTIEGMMGYICVGTKGSRQELCKREVTHLEKAGTKVLEEQKEPVMVGE